MLDCLILGDSLAVGVGQARPACETVARTGITSGTYIQSLFPATRKASQVVISLGVNDDPSMPTLENLRRLRRGVQSSHVTWLLPGLKEDVRAIIQRVAQENRDRVVDTRSQVGPDRLHPGTDGYRMIASWTEGGTAPPPIRQLASTTAIPRPNLATTQRLALPANGHGPQIIWLSPPPSNLPAVYAGSPSGRAVYGLWPPTGATYAAIPPRSFGYRAFPSLSTETR